MTITFQLRRNSFAQLVLTDLNGVEHVDVRPVRAFPIQSPNDGISLVKENGAEVAWIDHLSDLPAPIRDLISTELEGREFMPEINSITSVTSFATPCTWHVQTDRGATHFVLKGDEDIRRVGKESLLISDNHGIHFLIRNMYEIDKQSRKILDRFL
ncbi:cyanophycin metabolism-associated DUF1854 family protein [Undibacterium fentianense]|uniref:DUF1854 domain-containing protein n=1 Tax=Undibacterium fentianense TaxID=2828728 RepID=A0A941IDV0_9BURK|nr:DUF1854 domain-containing protein [Undibacterium fentianense]MBR7798961.1 DUF1854 domain-containing protein [Undibacterium fentianense]